MNHVLGLGAHQLNSMFGGVHDDIPSDDAPVYGTVKTRKMTEEERKALDEALAKKYPEEKKMKNSQNGRKEMICKMVKDGCTAEEIAEATGMSIRGVKTACSAYGLKEMLQRNEEEAAQEADKAKKEAARAKFANAFQRAKAAKENAETKEQGSESEQEEQIAEPDLKEEPAPEAVEAPAADEPVEDVVNHPRHYQTPGGIECIDMIKSTLGKDGYHAYCWGNAIKYIVRHEKKDGKISLQKAEWYIDEMIRGYDA
nr:DUF3310 domain-containing protein [Mitsuokella multacida]